MRERRRAPVDGSYRELPGRAHTTVQPAPRAHCRSAPLVAELSRTEGGDRGHLRNQPRASASARGTIEAQEAECAWIPPWWKPMSYEVYDHRPSDSDLLIGAVETHQAMLGRIPHLVAADA